MATLQERIETATDVLETDAGLMHSIIHGGSSETVETEGGPVPTVAKQVADMEASYAAIDAVAAVAADRQAAETARGGAEDARDVAVAATANMLVKGNNLSDVPDAAAARDNLGVTEAIALVARAATTERAGVIALATSDEAAGGVVGDKALTPATAPRLFAAGGTKSASFTIAAADKGKRFILNPAAAMTVTLPAPAAGAFFAFSVLSAAYAVTIVAADAATAFSRVNTPTTWLTQAGSISFPLVIGEVWLWTDGTSWYLIEDTLKMVSEKFTSKGTTGKTGSVYSNTGFKLADGTDIGTLFTAYVAACNCNCDCTCNCSN